MKKYIVFLFHGWLWWQIEFDGKKLPTEREEICHEKYKLINEKLEYGNSISMVDVGFQNVFSSIIFDTISNFCSIWNSGIKLHRGQNGGLHK